MGIVRHLQHWLSGQGPYLQTAEFVPETHPIRPWADTFPWDAMVDAVTQSFKPGQHRLCWLIPKHSEKRSCMRCLKPTKIKEIPLVERTPVVLEIHQCALTNRVSTLFTPVAW